MTTHTAHIERSNRKDLDDVEVQVTITDLSPGRQSPNEKGLAPTPAPARSRCEPDARPLR